jgi:curli biogenesis system outer membrane secretion channel CsgG
MKTLALLVMAMLAAGTLAGCGSGSATGATDTPTTQTQVTGLSTPKSVSVVTAN